MGGLHCRQHASSASSSGRIYVRSSGFHIFFSTKVSIPKQPPTCLQALQRGANLGKGLGTRLAQVCRHILDLLASKGDQGSTRSHM